MKRSKRLDQILYNYGDDCPPVLLALTTLAAQNPGLDYRDYGPGPYYRQDSRMITSQLHDVIDAVNNFYWLQGTDQDLIEASKRAFSGRIEISTNPVTIRYCAGQYYATEYRSAVAAVINYANSALRHKRAA